MLGKKVRVGAQLREPFLNVFMNLCNTTNEYTPTEEMQSGIKCLKQYKAHLAERTDSVTYAGVFWVNRLTWVWTRDFSHSLGALVVLYPCSIWLMHMERIKYNTVSSHEIKKWQPPQLNADATKTPIFINIKFRVFFPSSCPKFTDLWADYFFVHIFFFLDDLILIIRVQYTLQLNFISVLILQGRQEN